MWYFKFKQNRRALKKFKQDRRALKKSELDARHCVVNSDYWYDCAVIRNPGVNVFQNLYLSGVVKLFHFCTSELFHRCVPGFCSNLFRLFVVFETHVYTISIFSEAFNRGTKTFWTYYLTYPWLIMSYNVHTQKNISLRLGVNRNRILRGNWTNILPGNFRPRRNKIKIQVCQ